MSVFRKENIIKVFRMNHPKNVSDFLKALYFGAKHGFNEFILDFSEVATAFPNVCVPMAGVIQYYQDNGFQFTRLESMSDYIDGSGLLNPYNVNDNELDLRRHCLDRVWKFENSEDVNVLVDSYIEEISQYIECQKGVLEGLTWCLNEVMDNVIQHSNSNCGFVMGQIHRTSKHIAFCVFDSGQGIYKSLEESIHAPRNAVDAITLSIKEGVTRDTSIGQGNGMWGLHQIVQSNSGSLIITSSSASYMMYGDEVKTFNKLPFISKENASTTVDFQIDFDKEISISDALGGYEPINLRVEDVEDEHGHLVYKLCEKASGTGTRQSGEKIRNEIINLYNETGKVIQIDFQGIGVISSSFADELIGKMLVRFGFYNFNNIFRLKNMNTVIQAILHRSVAQRMAENFAVLNGA